MKVFNNKLRNALGFALIMGLAFSLMSCSNHKFSVELQVEKLNKNIQQLNDADSTAAVQLIQQKFQITDTVVRVDTILQMELDTVYREIETNDMRWKQFLVGRWYDMSKKKPQYFDFMSNGTLEMSGLLEELQQLDAQRKFTFEQTWDVYSSLLVFRTRISGNNKVKEGMQFSRIRYISQNSLSICGIESVMDIKTYEEIPERLCSTFSRNIDN